MKNNEFTKCIAIRDFVGDQKLNQLQFNVNTPVEINFNDPPQNGWRLGRVNNNYGVQQGWCPEWSFALPPNNNGQPPPPPMAAPPPPSSLSPRPPPSQQQQHQFQPSNVPVAGVDIAAFNGSGISGISGISGEFGGFDQRNNDVMGGNIPRATTADGTDMKNHLNPFEDVPDVTRADNNHKWNVSGIKKLLTPPKFHTNIDSSNPYTQKQKEPESDWTDGPQIMTNDMAALGNTNGRIAVIDTDGTTTTYKNQQSYQLATARNQFTDTMKTTTTNVSNQIQNLNLKLPDISKMHMNHNNTNDNNNNGNSNTTSGDNTNNNNNDNEGQQQQQQQQQNLVIDVNDDYNIDNEKTHNNIMNKFGRNMTKMSKKVSRSLSPKQQAYH